MGGTVEERFWSKVDKSGGDTACWTWLGATSRGGYGRFDDSTRSHPAHRWAYEQANGTIQPGLVMDHLCRSHSCVNPAHLEPVTSKENVLRGIGLSAVNARKRVCKRGHPFDDENTAKSGGTRHCRICSREKWKRSKLRIAARKFQAVTGAPFVTSNGTRYHRANAACVSSSRVIPGGREMERRELTADEVVGMVACARCLPDLISAAAAPATEEVQG